MLAALNRIALRDDPPALALRGIAMAQLGEHARARDLLLRAARGFGSRTLAHARCIVAEAEVALIMRDLGASSHSLTSALATLEAYADHANVRQVHLIMTRRFLLLGRLDKAGLVLEQLDVSGIPPSLMTVAELARAELELRSLRVDAAKAALSRACEAAQRARIPALMAEVAEACAALARPAARRICNGMEQNLPAGEVAALLDSGALVVDACRRRVGSSSGWHSLARRPILFALLRALAEAWPAGVDRNALIAQVFRTSRPDESHRARLRVQIGRLRALVKGLAQIEATERGFMLASSGERPVVVLLPPIDGEQASLLALLADGAAWSTSALALALGDSQRTVQRALLELEAGGQVRATGQGRARRWLAPPLTGFTTLLLLPTTLPME